MSPPPPPPPLQLTPGPGPREELFLFLELLLLLLLMSSAYVSGVTIGENFIAELDFFWNKEIATLQNTNRRSPQNCTIQLYSFILAMGSELIESGKMFYSRAKLILLFIDTMQLLAVIKTTDSRGGNVNKMPWLRINWISSSSSITYSWYKIGTWALLWLGNYSSQIKRKEEEHSTLLSYNVQNIRQPNQQGKYCVNLLVAE